MEKSPGLGGEVSMPKQNLEEFRERGGAVRLISRVGGTTRATSSKSKATTCCLDSAARWLPMNLSESPSATWI